MMCCFVVWVGFKVVFSLFTFVVHVSADATRAYLEFASEKPWFTFWFSFFMCGFIPLAPWCAWGFLKPVLTCWYASWTALSVVIEERILGLRPAHEPEGPEAFLPVAYHAIDYVAQYLQDRGMPAWVNTVMVPVAKAGSRQLPKYVPGWLTNFLSRKLDTWFQGGRA